MNYLQQSPSPILRPFVKTLWAIDSQSSANPPWERILPDGSMELIVHYGDCPTELDASGQVKTQCRTLLAGQIKTFMQIRPGKNAGMVGARFYPAGASRFFRPPMSDFSGQVHSLETLCKGAQCLEEQMRESLDHRSRFEVLEKYLTSRMTDGRPDLIVQEVAKKIATVHGMLDLRHIAKSFHIGERQVERRFQQSVGLSPKALARTYRLQYAIHMKEENETVHGPTLP